MSSDNALPRYANVYRELGDGRPDFSGREQLESGGERDFVLNYLRAGEILVRTSKKDDDLLDPERKRVIRTVIQTDGQWIWMEASIYYLQQYGIAPQQELLDHIRARGYRYPGLSRADLGRVADAFFEGRWEESPG